MGSPGVVSPTSNRGGEAAALQVIGKVIDLLGHAMTQAGASSEIGKQIVEIMNKLHKIVPPGSTSPAGQKNVMDQAQLRHAQQNPMAQQMRAMQAQKAGGGGGGGPPGMAA